MNYRDNNLDIAKGILIIFVVFGHAIQFSFGSEYTKSGLFFSNIVFQTIYSFHMPLFMLISGYLFYISNKKKIKNLIFSKLKTIGIPLLAFILICHLPDYIVLIYNGEIIKCLLSYINTIFRGGTMWFLFSLLLNISIIAIITRIVKTKLLQHMVMLFVFIVSLFIPDFILLSVHKYMYPFFCIGYIMKENGIFPYTCSENYGEMVVLTILSFLDSFPSLSVTIIAQTSLLSLY